MPTNRTKKRHIAAAFALLLPSVPKVRLSLFNGFKQANQTETVLNAL
jgi:hypothetical protein